MLNPFDSEFLSQELRETWKKVEELEKENKKLRSENEAARDYIKWQDSILFQIVKKVDYYQRNVDPSWDEGE